MAQRVLITDDVHPVLPQGLHDLGYAVELEPDVSLAEVRARVGDYHGLIINSKILVDKEMLDAGRQLRWVGRLGSGLEIVDLAYDKTRGAAILSSPAGNAPTVGRSTHWPWCLR